ncbi:lectin [Lysobacter sp. CA199]|uniref:lectin n=1 Tax=Lysobacter sp. CA199 TaxID=3455608 RepID=UPI003F8D3024
MFAPIRAAALTVLLLSLGLSACQREAAPAQSAPAADAAPTINPAPITDQPAENVPPATAPVSNPPPAADTTLARFDGYGDMRFGMTAEDAKKAWGGELKGQAATDGGCYYLRPIWVTEPRAFGFMFEAGKLVRLDVGNDKETAPGGGKRGMSADEIRKLYAGRVEEQGHKYVQGAKYLRVADNGGGSGVLVFETDATGKVVAWRVGVPPQVDYVEGCG